MGYYTIASIYMCALLSALLYNYTVKTLDGVVVSMPVCFFVLQTSASETEGLRLELEQIIVE